MRMSKIKSYLARVWIVTIFVLTLFPGSPVFGDEPKPSPDSELLATIRHMEASLLRPCNKVEGLMKDLIKYGRGYQLIEEERARIYSEWSQTFVKQISDFIIVTDKNGKAVPGKFIKTFYDLQKTAEEGGILAEGPKPNAGLIQLVHSKGKDKYFYFEDPDSAAGKSKRELRYKLEDAQQKLVEDWNKARETFYKQFEDKGLMRNYVNIFDESTKQGKEYANTYRDIKAELTTLAISGDFEHCLGKKKVMAYKVTGGNELFAALYDQGEKGTVDSLPGMGYKIVAQKEYKAIEKPDVGDFPLALNLKFNGTDYLKLERDLLKIKIEAEEEETRILGFGLGKVGQFGFEVTYKVTEALAAPVHMVAYVGSHPVDTMGKAVDFVKNVPQMVKDIGDWDVIGANKRAGDFLWGKTGNLIDAANEIAKDLNPITWDRFDPKPNETLQDEITRLGAQLESTKKVKEGMEVASDITAIVVQELLDKGIAKGLGVADKLRKGATLETKAASVLKKVDAIQDQAKVAKGAAAVSEELQQGAKTVKELAEEQLKLNRELQAFITGPKDRIPGKALPTGELKSPLTFKDTTGKEVVIPVGKQLGEGATSKAFINGVDDGLVVRVTDLESANAKKAQFLDEFGRKAIDEDVKSPFLRTAKREKVMDVVDENGVAQHVEYVEKVTPAKELLAKQGGQITKGQKLALEQATRDLNTKGYAWVDNHTGNYALEKMPGEDRWQVVVFDTGGIYPMKGATAAEKAVNARALQNTLIESDMTAKNSGVQGMYYGMIVRDDVYRAAGDAAKGIDLAKVNMTEAKQIGIGAGPGMRPDVGDIYKKSGEDLFKEVDDHMSKAISNDPAFKDLKAKYDAGQTKLDEALGKIEPQIAQAEKVAEGGPKALSVSEKPGGIDPALAEKIAFLSQLTAEAINSENCALIKKAILGGSKEQWLIGAAKDCAAQGY
jgi:hypothetical protein